MSKTVSGEENIQEHGELLGEFEKHTYEEWKEAAEISLKGASFEKKLFTKTAEGLTLRPIYNEENLSKCAWIDTLPGEAPYLRGTKTFKESTDAWMICRESYASDPQELNKILNTGLEKGETVLNLLLSPKTKRGFDADEQLTDVDSARGVSLCCRADFKGAFSRINLTGQPLLVSAGESALPMLSLLVSYIGNREVVSKLCGCVGADPLGVAAVSGKLDRDLCSLYDEMAALALWSSENTDGLRNIYVQGQNYHNAGADSVAELAFSISAGVEYLRAMIARQVPVDVAAKSVLFGFSAGSMFFTEIAKFRAVRVLWSRIVEAFGGSKDAQKIEMHVATSTWSQTVFDPHVNMIRATSQVFSAAVGGADSICAVPFDDSIRESDAFSRRIARNMQLILQDEGHLDHVIDPAGGSFYVESLTDEIALAAWNLFQDVERRGGLLKALEQDFVRSKIEATSQARKKNLAVRKTVIVGTNMYANATEQPLPIGERDKAKQGDAGSTPKMIQRVVDRSGFDEKLSLLHGKIKGGSVEGVISAMELAEAGATLGELSLALGRGSWNGPTLVPLKSERGAIMFEDLRNKAIRFEKEKGVAPSVFLANMGPIPQHKPRADFSRGFFEVGGFKVLDNDGFNTPEAAADATAESGAPIVVVCSTDPTYPQIIPPFVARLRKSRPNIIVVLAGYPKEQVEEHRASGVDEFIHMRSDVHALLGSVMDRIGGAS